MYIICELCYSKNGKWAAGNHDKFMEHLISSEHQENAMSKFTYAWENSSFEELFAIQDESRCLIVRGSYSLDDREEKKSLLESFGEFGILHDFVLLKQWPRFICALIFDSKDDVRNVMQQFKTTKTGKEVAFTSWRSDDWVLLRSEIQMPATEAESHRNLFPSLPEIACTVAPLSRRVQVNKRPVLDDPFSSSTGQQLANQTSKYTFEEMLESEKMPSEEIVKRGYILNELQEFFQKELPFCTLNPFGSIVTGIGTGKSPLDISFHPGDTLNKFAAMGKVRSILRAENLASREKPFLDIKQIVENTLPVVSFVHGGIGMKCKVFMDHSMAISTSHLLEFYLNFDPCCRPLALFIHHWAKVYNLYGKCQLSRYALNLMIIVYLSNSKIVPSVFVLQQLSSQRRETMFHHENHMEWDISFCKDVAAVRSYMSEGGYDHPNNRDLSPELILVLAKGFFEFYVNANLSRNMVCCYLARLLSKSSFEIEREGSLPQALFRYKQWAASVKSSIKRKSKLSAIGYLSIQDPFNHGANVCKGTNPKTVTFLEEACEAGLMGVKHFLSNLGGGGANNLNEIFSPILQAKNHEEFSPQKQTPKYRDPNVETRISNELNAMLCVAYPFLNLTDRGKILLFQPSKIFKHVFMQFFCGFTSQPILKKLLLYIWINFAQDFVVDYLTSCYFFRTQEKILPDCEQNLSEISSFSGNIQNRKRKARNSDHRLKDFRQDLEENRYIDSDSEDEADDNSICSDADDDDTDYDQSELQQDLDELKDSVNFSGQHMQAKMETVLDAYNTWGETVIRRLYTCECTDPVWDNREFLRAQLLKTQSHNDTSITHPLTLETMLSNLVQEASGKSKMFPTKVKQSMRLFLAYKTFVWKEHFSNKTTRVPLFLMLLRSDMDRFSQANLNHITHSIHKVFADYTKYRLKRWICD